MLGAGAQKLANHEIELVEETQDVPEKVVLTLRPSRLGRLEITDSNGLTHHKAVTLVELLKLLDRSATVEALDLTAARKVDVGAVPDRTLRLVTIEHPREVQVELTGWIEPFEHGFVYGERVYPIRLPALVYKALWSRTKRRLEGLLLSVAPVGEEIVTPKTPIYRWPFSNVWDSAKVCWPTMNQVTLGLEEIPRKGVIGFLSVDNNADLFGVGYSHNGPPRDYARFLEAVSAEGLKQEWLIPHGSEAGGS